MVSQLILQLRNGLLGCEMAHVCLGVVSQLRNFSQGGLCGCEMISHEDPFFAAKPQFHKRVLLAVKFLQDNEFLYFCASLILYGFLPPLLKFLLILIIQKPMLNQNKIKLKH